MIRVEGEGSESLQISESYRTILTADANGCKSPTQDRRHVRVFVSRANQFMECLNQRRDTLHRIAKYLVELQQSFLATGRYEFLAAMTRSQIAHALQMHESTISRALAGKSVRLPNGETLPFDLFFKPALRTQKLIEEILSTENPEHPFSDERIAEILSAQGIRVARRTVNKYRSKDRLLNSRKRRAA